MEVWKALSQDPPSVEALETCRALLEEQFEPISDVVWDDLERLIREEGWSERRLIRAYRFIQKNKSSWVNAGDRMPRISIGDFCRASNPKIYPHSWYEKQVIADEAKVLEIGMYLVPGQSKPVFGWKKDLDGLLDPWPEVEIVETLRLPPAPEDAPGGEKPEITDRDITAALTIQRMIMQIEDLQREVKETKAKLSDRELRILALKHDARQDQFYIDKLINRTFRHLEMLYPNATYWKSIEGVPATVAPSPPEGRAA